MRSTRVAAYVLALAGLLAAPLSARGGWLFGTPYPISVGDQPISVEVVDLNADGILDLAVTIGGGNPDKVCTLLGNGDGSFQAPVYFLTGQWPCRVNSGDFNGDTHVDLVVANHDTDDTSILLGNGDGTFAAAVNYAVGDGPYDVEVGLLNGDGFQDLAVINNSAASVSILLSNGDGTFQGAVNYPAGGSPQSLVIGDFDVNGDLDLAVANRSSAGISVLLGNGDGSFQVPVFHPSTNDPCSIAAADFNADTFQDLAVSHGGSNVVAILLGLGDGTFGTASLFGTGGDPFWLTIGEFDGDGIADLATANWDAGSCSVLLGNGDGTFQLHVDYATGAWSRHVRAADLDGDGNEDLVHVNHNADNVTVLFNLSPAEPEIVAITDVGNDQGGQVRIEWLASGSDAPGSTVPVTGYAIFRRQDANRLGVDQSLDHPNEDASAPDGVRLEGWDYIATIPAFGEPYYQCVAPTLCDSSELGGICWSVFMVRAAGDDPLLSSDSPPDSGYSVDNLAPCPPSRLRGEFDPPTGAITLSWPPSSSSDLQYYELHLGEGPDFEPGISNRIYADAETVFVDTSLQCTAASYYKVASVDFGGNRSECTSIPALETGIPDGELPRVIAAHPARPNPFRPNTTIAFDLPEAAVVNLRVYDASGRVVRTLLDGVLKEAGQHAELWDGRDGFGSRAASGVYFYRVEIGSEVFTRRMVLLK
jgi:hypothetical protein